MSQTTNPLLMTMGLATLLVPSTLLFISVNPLFFVPIVIGLGCAVVGCVRFSDDKKRRHTLVGALMCILASIGPFLLAAYANRSGSPIKFVLAPGYQGEFAIVKDRTNGTDLQFENGMWVFRIPPDGRLLVKDDYPFSIWHQESYVYSNGSAARVEPLGVTGGRIRTGPGSYHGSTDFDGTAHRWKVFGPRSERMRAPSPGSLRDPPSPARGAGTRESPLPLWERELADGEPGEGRTVA
jgi:hypothetical protein